RHAQLQPSRHRRLDLRHGRLRAADREFELELLSTTSSMTQSLPLSVGLVGAGPWARKAYAPMLAAGPETRLAAVWARRPEAARELAVEHKTRVAAGFEELLATSDAVAFAVPPDIQAG